MCRAPCSGSPTPSASMANIGCSTQAQAQAEQRRVLGAGQRRIVSDAELEIFVEQVDAAGDPDLELNALLLVLGRRTSSNDQSNWRRPKPRVQRAPSSRGSVAWGAIISGLAFRRESRHRREVGLNTCSGPGVQAISVGARRRSRLRHASEHAFGTNSHFGRHHHDPFCRSGPHRRISDAVDVFRRARSVAATRGSARSRPRVIRRPRRRAPRVDGRRRRR